MVLVVVIEKFLQYLEREKRYSGNTILAYQADLQQFLEYISRQYSIDSITLIDSSMIRSWIAGIMQQGHAKSTVNRKLSTLKTFFRFSFKSGYITLNPLERLLSIKKDALLPGFVPEEKMHRLLDQSFFEPNFRGIRDLLILELFYTTGMRLSELCKLKQADIDTDQLTAKITGKRSRQRVVPLLRDVADRFKEYIMQRDKEFNFLAHPYVFVTERGTPVYPKFVYRLVTSNLGRVTTSSKRSPHLLRHTFATHMLNQGADLNAIKEILGHSSLSATQVYTHNSVEKIKKVYKQAHPKA
ncbi:MAG TPA: tyrosine-type recombinase/integrase [Bacteroidales bacterium]|nr:tyrosine-type recombinase/integrase [Bacteroidales bacterium]